MRTHGHATLLTTSLMVAALGVFHIARPVAVSAQASASVSVSATVIRSDAGWSGHEMGRTLVHSMSTAGPVATDGTSIVDGSVARIRAFLPLEREGTVAWVEPPSTPDGEPTVTVAHLGS